MSNKKWEQVAGDDRATTLRLRVQGGWLYKEVLEMNDLPCLALAFVPDPDPLSPDAT